MSPNLTLRQSSPDQPVGIVTRVDQADCQEPLDISADCLSTDNGPSMAEYPSAGLYMGQKTAVCHHPKRTDIVHHT